MKSSQIVMLSLLLTVLVHTQTNEVKGLLFTDLPVESTQWFEKVVEVTTKNGEKMTADSMHQLVSIVVESRITSDAVVTLSNEDACLCDLNFRVKPVGITLDSVYETGGERGAEFLVGKECVRGSIVQARLLFNVPLNTTGDLYFYALKRQSGNVIHVQATSGLR